MPKLQDPWKDFTPSHTVTQPNIKCMSLMVYFQEHRILLTGTPLQNNVDELFSLLNFLEPAQFPSQVAFLMEFGDLKTEAQVEKLKQVCWCWYFVYSLWYSHGFLILFFFCSMTSSIKQECYRHDFKNKERCYNVSGVPSFVEY